MSKALTDAQRDLEDLHAELANHQADALAAAQFGAAESAAISVANAEQIAERIPAAVHRVERELVKTYGDQ